MKTYQSGQSIVEQTRFANIVTRAIIRKDDGSVLLVKEGKPTAYGLWTVPGGKVDVGESLTQAALREVKEEVGLDVELLGIVSIHHERWEDAPGFSLQINFLAKLIGSTEPSISDPREILAYEWVNSERLKELHADHALRGVRAERLLDDLDAGTLLPLSALYEG